MVFCKKEFSCKFCKIHQRKTCAKVSFIMNCRSTEFNFIKKDIPAQMFSCEFCEISYNTFFKERIGRLLLHKHSFCLLSHHDLSHFQKRCHTYFLAEYFLILIYKLGTRVRSIFQTLS